MMKPECFGKYGSRMEDSDLSCPECEYRNPCCELFMVPVKIIEKATKQLQYDILCLGDEEILALSRIIHAYVVSQDQSYAEKEDLDE